MSRFELPDDATLRRKEQLVALEANALILLDLKRDAEERGLAFDALEELGTTMKPGDMMALSEMMDAKILQRLCGLHHSDALLNAASDWIRTRQSYDSGEPVPEEHHPDSLFAASARCHLRQEMADKIGSLLNEDRFDRHEEVAGALAALIREALAAGVYTGVDNQAITRMLEVSLLMHPEWLRQYRVYQTMLAKGRTSSFGFEWMRRVLKYSGVRLPDMLSNEDKRRAIYDDIAQQMRVLLDDHATQQEHLLARTGLIKAIKNIQEQGMALGLGRNPVPVIRGMFMEHPEIYKGYEEAFRTWQE